MRAKAESQRVTLERHWFCVKTLGGCGRDFTTFSGPVAVRAGTTKCPFCQNNGALVRDTTPFRARTCGAHDVDPKES